MQIGRHMSSKCSCGERARAAHRRARHQTMALFINTKYFLLYKRLQYTKSFLSVFLFPSFSFHCRQSFRLEIVSNGAVQTVESVSTPYRLTVAHGEGAGSPAMRRLCMRMQTSQETRNTLENCRGGESHWPPQTSWSAASYTIIVGWRPCVEGCPRARTESAELSQAHKAVGIGVRLRSCGGGRGAAA